MTNLYYCEAHRLLDGCLKIHERYLKVNDDTLSFLDQESSDPHVRAILKSVDCDLETVKKIKQRGDDEFNLVPYKHFVLLCQIAAKKDKAEFLSAILMKRNSPSQYGLSLTLLLTWCIKHRMSQTILNDVVDKLRPVKMTIDHKNPALAASGYALCFELVRETMKFGDPQLMSRIVNVLPHSYLVSPTGDDLRPYSRLVELFVDEEAWNEDCVKILMNWQALNKDVLDKNKNTFLHQLAIFHKPSQGLQTFQKRFEFALTLYESSLNEVNAFDQTVADILIQNRHQSLARLVNKKVGEQRKSQRMALDDLLAEIQNQSAQQGKAKKKKRKPKRKLDNLEESKEPKEKPDSQCEEAVFNPQDFRRAPEEQDDGLPYYEDVKKDLTPFAPRDTGPDSPHEETVRLDDYEKLQVQKEFLAKQQLESQKQIEALQKELAMFRAGKK